ncbi:DoxX family protein [Methylobacterium oryzihabitans]|uniref:DoxX family protein n=1 Tax=Methylobacterium oryzihabitans TaxID=2499852 RepID=A0A437NYX5_9HYPH|nr:DoxX family protein [Methylobacterium oryzihabitans]RVU15195.1 DoxX family protein [Methylobacterium oryzihabitans]
METWPKHLGTALLVVVELFLVLDAGMKLLGAQAAVDATGELGFSAQATRMLGLVLGAATILYALPGTRVLGAILLTGYLGGAVAVQALHGAPLLTHTLFGVYFGVAAWGAIWLRSHDLRALVPLARRRTT